MNKNITTTRVFIAAFIYGISLCLIGYGLGEMIGEAINKARIKKLKRLEDRDDELTRALKEL